MKLSKMLTLTLGSVFITGILGAGAAHALVCPKGKIHSAAVYSFLPDTVKYVVTATCDTAAGGGYVVTGGTPLRYFIGKDGNEDSHYAAALTAVSGGLSVKLNISNDAAQYGLAKLIEVQAQ
ncbi:MAG: hypothetical protein D3924_11335 [Candidatus Electrothrix sp. AR4]|nr:hypothetical protein [Candidatus Electrothrix sp. AR4]